MNQASNPTRRNFLGTAALGLVAARAGLAGAVPMAPAEAGAGTGVSPAA